jgi:hypothetical protein
MRVALAVLAGVLLSVTVNVSENEPVDVGMPLKMPRLLKAMPVGSVPATVQVNLPTPPCSRSICVNGWPSVAPKSEVVVMLMGARGAVL